MTRPRIPLRFPASHKQNMVRIARSAIAALASLLLSGSLPAFGQPNTSATIQHIIIIVKENRSFDHYFGTFPGSTAVCAGGSNPGAACTTPNGPECMGGSCPYITTGNCELNSNGGLVPCPSTGVVQLTPGISTQPDCSNSSYGGDCPHSVASIIAAEDGGKMDGFGGYCPASQNQCWPGVYCPPVPTGNNKCVMAGYEQYNGNPTTGIPFYWQMASTYGLGDHFFSYPNGPSYPNHLNMIAAQANEALDNPTGPPVSPVVGYLSPIAWTCDETIPSPTGPPPNYPTPPSPPTCKGTCRVGADVCGTNINGSNIACSNGSQCINLTCTGAQNTYAAQVLSQTPAQDSISGTVVQAGEYYYGGVCQDSSNAACICASQSLPPYPLSSCSPGSPPNTHGGDSCNNGNGGQCSPNNATYGTPNSLSNTRGGICPEVTTVTDRLDAAGVSWGYYAAKTPTALGYQWTAPAYVQHIRFGPDWATNVHAFIDPITGGVAFDEAVAATTPQNNTNNPPLENVVWVSAGTLNSEHPFFDHCGSNPQCNPQQDIYSGYSSTVSAGEAWTQARLQAIFNNSTVYNSSIIFVVWDDFGGFYDHMAPPSGLGIRVPILCIGPFCKNAVIHSQLEFGSILHCIENPPAGLNGQAPWTLNNLGGRDILAANDACAAMVNLAQAPIQPPSQLARLVPAEKRLLQKKPADISDPDLVTLAKFAYHWLRPVKQPHLEADDSSHPVLATQRPCLDGTKPHRAYYVTKAGKFPVEVCGSDDGKLILWPGETHRDADEPDEQKTGGKSLSDVELKEPPLIPAH